MKFNNPRAQRGLSFWYFIWQVVLFICLAYLLIIGIPPYLDNAKLKRALESLAEEPRVMQMSKPQMIKLLNRKLNIDIADDIVNLKQVFKVKNVEGRKELSIDYEIAVPVVYNISMLLDFENHVLTPKL